MTHGVRTLLFLLWGAGALLLAILLVHFGAEAIMGAVAATGWGLLIVAGFHLVPMTLDTLAWVKLLPRKRTPTFRQLLYLRWIGESVNGLLPAAQVGGDLVRARLLLRHGVSKRTAAASVIVNLTLSVATLFVFCLAGALALAFHTQPAALANTRYPVLIGGLGLAVLVTGGLVVLQRRGAFQGMIRLVSLLVPARDLSVALGGASRLDQTITETYRRHRELLASTAWTLLGWVAGTGEIWLALYFLGYPISLYEAFIIESLVQAVRNGAFFIPGALGIQEGGLVLIGSLFGLSPETGLALALIKRVRELALGIPGLVIWQLSSSINLLRGNNASTPASCPSGSE
ncbi:MAG: flippase-like domain-containing protein [Gammaproteobacteria bacterium]